VETNEGRGRVIICSDIETGKVEGFPHLLASKRGRVRGVDEFLHVLPSQRRRTKGEEGISHLLPLRWKPTRGGSVRVN